jgi:hypothetical protein
MATTRRPGRDRSASLRTPPPPRGSKGPSTGTKARAWASLGGIILGVVLLLWIGTRLLGGGGDEPLTPTGPTGPTGAGSVPFASPPPPGSVRDTFPLPAIGARLELKVIALGDKPSACVAESLRIGGDVRSVYHHRCPDDEAIDRLYVLVRVTNLSEGRVPLQLSDFTLRADDGKEYEALATPPVGVPATRFFPQTATIGPDVGFKRWVTFDGSDVERPADVTYEDGPESLSVRFRGDWV